MRSRPSLRRPILAGLPVLLLAALSGCGLATLGGGEGVDPTTTGSIAPASPPAGPAPAPVDGALASPVIASVAAEDWESMRSLAAAKLDKAPNGATLDWTSTDTGDNGTLVALGDAKPRTGAFSCRPVALTVSDMRGIRRYSGNACSDMRGAWQLRDVAAEDMALVKAEVKGPGASADPALATATASSDISTPRY